VTLRGQRLCGLYGFEKQPFGRLAETADLVRIGKDSIVVHVENQQLAE